MIFSLNTENMIQNYGCHRKYPMDSFSRFLKIIWQHIKSIFKTVLPDDFLECYLKKSQNLMMQEISKGQFPKPLIQKSTGNTIAHQSADCKCMCCQMNFLKISEKWQKEA